MISRLLRWRLAPLLLPLAVVAASVVAVAVGVVGMVQADRTYRDLARSEDGESIAIEVVVPARQSVWVRHDDYGGASPAVMTVTVEHEGATVTARALPGDVTYQETDTAITALWAFDASQPGTYTVKLNDINGPTSFLVGAGNPQAHRQQANQWTSRGLLGIAVGLIGLAVVGVALGRPSNHPVALDARQGVP